MKKSIALILILTFTFVFAPVSFSQEAQSPNGDITFQENIIPDVNVYYDDYSFVFEYKSFFIRIRPFVIYDEQFYGMKQIVQWIKNNYPNVDYKWLVDKAVNAIHYGFNLTKLPQKVADKIDYLGFRLVDLNFPLSWFELETIEEYQNKTSFELYNVTRILIPKANLVFSFEDLYPYGYEITHVNSTYVLIGNVRGRENLYVDPITKSGSLVTVDGTYTNLGEDIYQADQTGGWGVMFRNQFESQYWLNASLQIGDGSNITSASDTNSILQIGNATFERTFEVKPQATFQLGTKEADGDVKDGCTLILYVGTAKISRGTVNLYDSVIKGYGSIYVLRVDSTIDFKENLFDFVDRQIWIDNDAVGTMERNYFHGNGLNLIIETDDVTWRDCFLSNFEQAIRLASSITIQDFTIEHSSQYDVYLRHVNAKLYAVDSTLNWSMIGGVASSQAFEQYTFNLNVTFQNGTAIGNANVTMYDTNGTQVFSQLTYANGTIDQQTITSRLYENPYPNTITDYNPFNLTITYSGYQTYTALLDVAKETDLTIALQESTAVAEGFNSTYYLLGAVTFLPFLLFGLVLWRRKRKK